MRMHIQYITRPVTTTHLSQVAPQRQLVHEHLEEVVVLDGLLELFKLRGRISK
jgi:hypothetical protein